MTRFVDTNVFLYAMTAHSEFGDVARRILRRIQDGELAVTSTLVLCELAWVLEAKGMQPQIKPTFEAILSYKNLSVVEFGSEDLLVGSSTAQGLGVDFNDGVNLSVMERLGLNEVYSNDKKHLGKLDFIATRFE